MSKVEEPDTSDGSDDEDYKPERGEACPGSEEDSDDATDSSDGESRGKKSQKPHKKRRKKDNGTPDRVEETVTDEQEKKHADALWADFLSDVDPPPRREDAPKEAKVAKRVEESPQSVRETPQKAEKLPPVEKVFNFAGEEVKVPVDSAQKATKRPPPAATARPSRSSGGLSSILGSIGKKPKMGTLEKSKLDWDRFKNTEGINEELATFNKGKDGYLERQDFLERTDYRQFDLERDMRQKKRSSR
ncbi:craniofacial development protein 1 [Phlebotomus argentipes]|uniref:craniofacial development protein 1 n=1 Tax=Phlebotomus argentipes TaxID=94469 RepID=UPI002892CB85|nr:craniofacial development protein 1 [Phlebotomus argentipes]